MYLLQAVYICSRPGVRRLHVRISGWQAGRTIRTEYYRVCPFGVYYYFDETNPFCQSHLSNRVCSIIPTNPPIYYRVTHTHTHRHKQKARPNVLYPFVSAIGHGIQRSHVRARRKTKHHKTKLHNNLHPKRLHASTHTRIHTKTHAHTRTHIRTLNPQRIRL